MDEGQKKMQNVLEEMENIKVAERIIDDLVCIFNRLYALDCYLAKCDYDSTIAELRDQCIRPALDSVSLLRWAEQVKKLSSGS